MASKALTSHYYKWKMRAAPGQIPVGLFIVDWIHQKNTTFDKKQKKQIILYN